MKDQNEALNKDLILSDICKNKHLINPSLTKFPIYNPKIKLGVLASGTGSNFESLIKSIIQQVN